jgi:hypothetical protein
MIEKVKIENAIGVPVAHAVIGELPTQKPGAPRAMKRGVYHLVQRIVFIPIRRA